ncbi:hypothetical protein [Kineobactrum sediminis]|uniref:hypothetical protein n=1 Tax=Kineobactrum sediminis TaxID=1905677 RepID=UPI0011AF8286|nr:hypothetical protein [Kineobactrum sediminis]
MFKTSYTHWSTLVRRELQEYRGSLVWTPLAIACVLVLIMLAGIFFANRFSVLGGMGAVVIEQSGEAVDIRIGVRGSGDTVVNPDNAADPESDAYRIQDAPEQASNGWDFSRDWKELQPAPPGKELAGEGIKNLNPVLDGIHSMMMLVLILVTANYLLGCLYADRKDRSILFWKSMPVSARDEVIAKLGVATLVAPALFIAASLLAQLAMVLLAVLLAARAGLDVMTVVLGNIEFGALLWGQVGGWMKNALWIAPVYAWLMLASAAAKRSPFLFAVAPVIALLVLEKIMLGSHHVGTALLNHLPQYVVDADTSNDLPFGLNRVNVGYISLLLGLLSAFVLLWLAVWLRRHRWEL